MHLTVYSYAERDPSILGASNSDVVILGLCTGLLPAATAATARDTTELLKISVEVVAVAFRLALETTQRSKNIEDGPGCWGFSVINVPPEEQQAIINDFHKAKVSFL